MDPIAADDDATLEIRWVADDGTAVVHATGDIDLATVDQLRATLHELDDQPVDRLVFDLSEVSFLDSSGLSFFLEVSGRSRPIQIRSPSTTVRRVIETTGLAEQLPMVP